MDLGLNGKVAIVAASSQGLGKAAALELAREGAHVTICARNADELEHTAQELRKATGSEILAVAADMTNPDQIKQVVDATLAKWGAIHILVANAGGAPAGKFDVLDDQAWEKGWRLNFLSTVQQIRAVLPYLRDAGWGRIITITSVSVKQPIDDLLISSAVRPGVVGLVRALATQLGASGITVNNVAPGYTKTDRINAIFDATAADKGISPEAAMQSITSRTAIGRMAEPDEIGAAIAFLASSRAASITGQTLLVDGGSYRGLA